MTIKIVTVGSKPSTELNTLINDYITRMPRSINYSWQFIKHGEGNSITSKQQESENILRYLDSRSLVVLLDETGSEHTSEKFSEMIFKDYSDVIFIIGGAYGVSDEIKKRSDKILSLSKMVMPHQLVRLVLVEQIYRAYTISINHPYHHS